MTAMNLTEGFVHHLEALWTDGLDDEATRTASRLVLDGIAVGALGARQPGPRLLAELALGTGAAPAATLIGHKTRTSAAEAARANGAAMHVLDYEPMWNPANHALSTTLPAVLALAEVVARRAPGAPKAPDLSGQAVLRAFALGVETQGRLRRASLQFEPAGLTFHPPGVVGPLGSAIACGLLIGLDSGQLLHALGIAASRAGTILANVGSMTKALHCGGAAAAGLEAALLAARGFTSDADPLAGPRGYLQAFFGAETDPDALTAPAGKLHIVSPGPAYKFYPSQYGTHFVITAALDARRQLPENARIARVRIIAPQMPYVDRAAPATGLAGKFSFQYTAALGLLDGTATVESFTNARRNAPDMVALLDATTIEIDPAREGRFDRMTLDVVAETEDGQTITGRCDGPPGIWGKPPTDKMLDDKMRDCLSGVFDAARVGRIMERAHDFAAFAPADLIALLDDLATDTTEDTKHAAA
jgi:aconitate decarboxylase